MCGELQVRLLCSCLISFVQRVTVIYGKGVKCVMIILKSILFYDLCFMIAIPRRLVDLTLSYDLNNQCFMMVIPRRLVDLSLFNDLNSQCFMMAISRRLVDHALFYD